MKSYKQVRIQDEGKDYPEVVVSRVDFLREFQIEQGGSKEPCDLTDRSNDVISISYPQAIAIAKAILEMNEGA